MPYLVPLTFSQAVYLGATGLACLSVSYFLTQIIKDIDRIAQSNIDAIANTPPANGMNISNLSIYLKRAAILVSLVTAAFLSCIGFLLWCVGTACITYASIGPLL